MIALHALLPFTTGNAYWKVYADAQALGGDLIARILLFSVVPAFIFASGFLMENSLLARSPSFGDFLGARIKRLLVPWFLVMLVWLVPLYTLFDVPAYGRPDGGSFWETLLAGLQGRFTDHLWFLLVLFWATLFWLLVRPLMECAARLPIPSACAKPDWVPYGKIAEARAKLEEMIPAPLKSDAFKLQGEKPALTLPDLAGFGVALVAVFIIQAGTRGVTWFCLNETAGPVLFLYCGMLARRHEEWLNAFLWKNYLKIFPVLALAFLILLPAGNSLFVVPWLLGVIGALLIYQLCLGAVRIGFPAKKPTGAVAFFEQNAFRYYLFHMPTTVLVFTLLDNPNGFHPWVCILLTLVSALAITTIVVRCSRALEERFLPKIFSGMRPNE